MIITDWTSNGNFEEKKITICLVLRYISFAMKEENKNKREDDWGHQISVEQKKMIKCMNIRSNSGTIFDLYALFSY